MADRHDTFEDGLNAAIMHLKESAQRLPCPLVSGTLISASLIVNLNRDAIRKAYLEKRKMGAL